MKTSRRNLLLGSLGAVQLGLLSRFGLRSAHAGPTPQGPTKLLCIWLDGGCNWETLFAALTGAGIDKWIMPPDGDIHPIGYSKAQVRNWDGSQPDLNDPGPVRKLRGPVYWNGANPTDATGTNPLSGNTQIYRPWGYSWVNPKYNLFNKTCVLVGADQGSAAHQSSIVASMCGVAGTAFRAPAIAAVVANYMSAYFPDRPVPNAVLGGMSPLGTGLPSRVSPYGLASLGVVETTISDRREGAWAGLRTRTDVPAIGFDGTPGSGTVPLTITDAALMEDIRARRGHSTSGTDEMYRQLYETTAGISKTVARDVITQLQKVPGFEHLQKDPLYAANGPMMSACIGSADKCGPVPLTAPYDFALKLLKSNMVTSLTLRASSIANFSFDVHFVGGARAMTSHLRIAFEGIAQMLIEMQLTPSSTGSGTLLDETLVYIYSDFGRTFPKVSTDGSDHHPATCGVLVGGNVRGNQMLGGYNEAAIITPMGAPVGIIDEGGQKVTRTPTAADVAGTVIRAFGLQPGKDFFIPGGYGVFDGALNIA